MVANRAKQLGRDVRDRLRPQSQSGHRARNLAALGAAGLAVVVGVLVWRKRR